MSDLKIKYRPIESLKEYDRNSRTHSKDQIAELKRSIQEFGFTNPVLITAENEIIAGHGRVQAAQQLGLESVPTITLGDLSDEQRRAYVIADNKLAMGAGWNEKRLVSELTRLQESRYDATLTGFSQEELKKLLSLSCPGDDAQVHFSEELDESHNYVVIYFGNEMDWLSAQTHFNLQSVSSKRQNGKAWSKGIGRVIDGAKYLNDLKK